MRQEADGNRGGSRARILITGVSCSDFIDLESISEAAVEGAGRGTHDQETRVTESSASQDEATSRGSRSLPITVIAAQTGVGKTFAVARIVGERGKTIWLADRISDVDMVCRAIEDAGGSVGRVARLTESLPNGVRNCIHPKDILKWQRKGYDYRSGYCRQKCSRNAEAADCPFLNSIDRLDEADTIVVTKAMARGAGFFAGRGNTARDTIVIDEDPIGLLRRPVTLTSGDVVCFLSTLEDIIGEMQNRGETAGVEEAIALLRIGEWCRDALSVASAGQSSFVLSVPRGMFSAGGRDEEETNRREEGRKVLRRCFEARMRRNPDRTIRNVARDLRDLASRAAGGSALIGPSELAFHASTTIPSEKRVIVLDATPNPDLLGPIFAPRPIRVICDERVEPIGRVIQFMDFNGPRSYLDRIPRKVVEMIDALGDRYPDGRIVLISHKSNVERLKDASRHSERITVAHFGALRGRNDLMSGPTSPIACHIVLGSPKTNEAARQHLALAIHGEQILPFPPLETMIIGVLGRVPRELSGDQPGELHRLWEVVHKGYPEPRMQSIYMHTVAAELAHAADRARVVSCDATVFLLTNETCPWLWHAEKCLSDEYLGLPKARRADFDANYANFEATALGLLRAGKAITGTSVCRAMGRAATWGKRYWRQFRAQHAAILEGSRTFRLKVV